MRGLATCFGAGTIVNAIATGKGAAFGLALRATAVAEVLPGKGDIWAQVAAGVDPSLVRGCAQRVLRRAHRDVNLSVSVDSDIPISRGLKSSSAVANAAVLASARAFGLPLEPLEVVHMGVEAAFEAGVTITGAFDDACASFFGGIVVTDNRARKVEKMDRFLEDLVAVLHIPRRAISKPSLAAKDFSFIRPRVDKAYRLALQGDYFRAIELNSAAYAPLLEIDETPARRARDAGAVAAGITGTGPSILALVNSSRADAVAHAVEDGEAEVRIVSLNTIDSREVAA